MEKSNSYTFKYLPKALQYDNLITFLGQISKEFCLAKNDQLKFSNNVNHLLLDLEQYKVREEYVSQWPGTKLLEHKAKVFYFVVNPKTISVLKKHGDQLSDWQAPELLEDLAFFREDGTIIFYSVIHEDEAGFDLTEREFQLLTSNFPQLLEMLKTHVPGSD